MARMHLIVNPIAGKTSEDRLVLIRRVLQSAGWQVEVLPTRGHGDARRLAAQAVADGTEMVAVLGGDGTSIQAASALVGTGIPLGLLPGGTGNVLGGNLRIPRDPVRAAEVIARGKARRIDLGQIERSDGMHYFGVACGAGADAMVMGETATGDKRRLGIAGYWRTLFRVLPRIRSQRFRLTIDGVLHEVDAAVVLVLNCGEIIPPLPVSRRAELDDGVFEIMALAANSGWDVFRGMARALGNVILDGGDTSYLRYFRGASVTVVPDHPERVQYDGDLAETTPLSITMCPGAIDVIAPVSR